MAMLGLATTYPANQLVGTLNEDFAVESIAGDVFQLGNTSYRILRVEKGRVRVEDANGAPPSIPFWLGEAAGRSDELSQAVSRLREAVVLAMTKRTPWASAILTGAWFLIVTVGTLATIVSYAVEGGLGSSGGVVMAGGILTLGLFFIFSGLVTVVMAYRMENSRLAALQKEFQDTLTGRVPATR